MFAERFGWTPDMVDRLEVRAFDAYVKHFDELARQAKEAQRGR